ncbi:MAG: thioredoxin family protein [Planctomycetaceae bacterium]
MKRCMMTVLGLAAVLGLLAATADAAKFNKQVNVGDAAPTFAGLPGTDDKSHSLSDFKDAQVVVVAFTCNGCPVAKAYEERFVEFTNSYKDKGVAFVAINVNNVEADKLPAMKKRAEQKGLNYPYLYDASQASAKQYGATVTPHLFVLDKDRKIAYMGAFDDEINPANVKQNYVPNAVDALLAGQAPEITESRQFGCGIKFD